MKFKLVFTIGILLVLAFIVYKSVDFKQLSSNISRFPQYLLYIALTLATILTVLKTIRLRILLKKNNISPKFWPVYRLFTASQAITALPGGEASRAYFVTKETNATLHQAATPVLIQAMLELFSSVVVVIICSLFYPQLLSSGIIAFVVLSAVSAIFINTKVFTTVLNKASKWQTIKTNAHHLKEIQKNIKTSIFKEENSYYPTKTIIAAFLLGIATNIVGGLVIVVITSGFKQNISLFNATFAYAGGVAIQGLSTISPGGLGFTEGGMTGILHLSGIKNALEIVLIFRFVTFIYYTLLGLLFILLFYRKDLLTKDKGADHEN